MTHCPHCGEKTWTDGAGCENGACMDPRDTLPAHVIPCPDRREWRVEAWGMLS